MKLTEFKVMTDENIDPNVVKWLRTIGFDVFDISENGLQGSTDDSLIRIAAKSNRIIISHDADFGTMAFMQGKPIVGLLFIRPGHISADVCINVFKAVLDLNILHTPNQMNADH